MSDPTGKANLGLPPLNALKAFDAVTRLGSINKASAELGIAPSSVTQHIRNLEDFLGGDLFARTANSIELNDRGKTYARDVQSAFDLIQRSTGAVGQQTRAHPIRISCVPTLAGPVMAEPVARLHKEFPNVEIRMEFSPDLAEFDADTIDIAVRYGSGTYPGAICELLHVSQIAPVCSPETAATLHNPADLGRILRAQSVESAPDGSCLWAYWAKQAGQTDLLKPFETGAPFVLQSSEFSVALLQRMSIVAVLEHAVARAHLASGALVAPVDIWVPAPFGYHLVTPKRRSLQPAAKRLKSLIKRSVIAHFKREA